MKFASSYEPNQYESDIYAAWETSGVFNPPVPTVPVDDDASGHDDREESRPKSTKITQIEGHKGKISDFAAEGAE